ncbi:hypothetical protein JZ751_006402 [Albula glossodonta]|uniref:SH3 domain containing ring finger 2 n=1 Tax=Albula glossodonta TaxID=121402 RepID=A0A8T2N3Q9_9TELE|nr:hypothetical protein JZ751_006402 [Albula glossodonta]
MDELALLDLLECPLCLEKLDVTAKVLPCQHTFCKPCLRRLAATRSELRCPECRTLVPSGIEELPANLLLMRLLEGLRQGPGGAANRGSARYSVPLAQDRSGRKMREAQSSQPPQHRQMPAHRSALDGASILFKIHLYLMVPWARALYNYRGNAPGELNVKTGDVIILRRKVDENWYHGETNGSSGLVPANMVHVVNQLPQPLPLCRALYDFDIKDKDQEDTKDCLTFLKVSDAVASTGDDGPRPEAEGSCGERLSRKEDQPNSAAAKLLDKRKGSSSSEPGIRTRSASTSRLCPNVPGTPATLNRPGPLSHSAQGPPDISPPIFLGSSNPAVVTRVGESRTESNSNGVPQVNAFWDEGGSDLLGSPVPLFGGPVVILGERKSSSDPSPTVAMALINPQPHSASTESKQSSTHQLSINVCAALYSYTPRRPEELELRKGEMVGVYGKFKEGWLRGLSLRTGKVGILPANYVTPVLRTSARFLDPKSTQSTISGKRPVTAKPQAPVTMNNTVRPSAQVPLVAMAASGSGMRQAQQEGVQGRGTLRLRGSSMQGSLHGRNPGPGTAVVRPQQQPPPGGMAPVQGLACIPVMQRGKHGLPENSGRAMCWMSEVTAPSAGDNMVLDPRDSAAKESLERQGQTGLQSILVKPDAHKNNTDKPMKSVRFLTQEAPATEMKTVGGQGSSSIQPASPGQEVWASQSPPVHLAGGSILMDSTAASQKRVLPLSPITIDGHPPSLNSVSSSITQPSACRHRVMAAYTAQTDAELHLREGELVLVQKPRQDGRVLVTQEKSGKTGLFHNSVLEVLQKLS